MNIIRNVVLGSFLAATLLTGPIFAGVDVNIGIGAPLFYPAPEYRYEQGYYRTYNGYPYYYDNDRRGWHYGHNRDEGRREEERRGHKEHHDNGRHNGR